SAALVAIGLYVRVALVETPAFRAVLARQERLDVPLLEVLRNHWRPLIQGSLAIVVCYALFYISSVFALGYGVKALHIALTDFLGMLCVAAACMALATPLSAALADRYGRRPVLLGASALAALVGFAMPSLLSAGPLGALAFLCLALGVMGLTFAPLGALLPELFPPRVGSTPALRAPIISAAFSAPRWRPTSPRCCWSAAASTGSATTSSRRPRSALSVCSASRRPRTRTPVGNRARPGPAFPSKRSGGARRPRDRGSSGLTRRPLLTQREDCASSSPGASKQLSQISKQFRAFDDRYKSC
ncbi:MAG: MFS transporter, partial [Roseiarcus sp.]